MDISGTFQSFVEWLKGLWESIDIKAWAEGVGGSSSEAVQGAIYLGGGFAIGFLFKKYFKFVFFSLLLASLIILLLQYNKVLEIDWQGINMLMGFEPTADIGILLNYCFEFIRKNLLISIASFVGFLMGYKLG